MPLVLESQLRARRCQQRALLLYPDSSALGPSLHGHGVAAGQRLVPIIRWGLKRLLRVESAEFGQSEAARVALLAASCGA